VRYRRGAAIVPVAGLVALAIGALAGETEAHGGRVQLAKAPAGPYLVSVWTLPDPPRVGSLDVSLAVMEPRTERALLDATARLTATPRGGPAGVLAHALERGAGGNPILYHALLDVPAAGPWQVTITVDGPAGSGQVGFDLAVERAPSILWSVAPGVAVGLALLAWWLMAGRRWRSRS
jgi:hypothetical protein